LTDSGRAISTVGEDDLADLLPLFRAYSDFYEVQTPDDDLLALCRALIADPEREGVQLIAREGDGNAVGFATIYWLWSSLRGRRLALMNDLFVAPAARGTGLADELIAECAQRGREHGAAILEWETALDNERAQRVYERTGAPRSTWYAYDLELTQEGTP